MHGTVRQDGTTYLVDAAGTLDRSSNTARLETGAATADVVISGGATYLRGNLEFWTLAGAPAAVAKAVAATKKWVKAPPGQATSTASSLSFGGLVKMLFAADSGSVNPLTTDVTSAVVDGVDCWVLADRLDATARLSVAKATGLPVRLTGTSGGAGGDLAFDRWNAVPAASAPAPGDVISLG